MFATDNPARLTAPSPEIGEGWGGVLCNPCVVFFFQIGISSHSLVEIAAQAANSQEVILKI
ncbi:hypothetical protein CEN49_03675 [Fischerella thermalis CCMEE 5273]|nr:hypothetical protein CEN49_03675 [Fischerella thermalis CCMEE 5273]